MEQFVGKLRRVGNSLVVTIPKIVYTNLDLKENDCTYFLVSKDKNPRLHVQTDETTTDQNDQDVYTAEKTAEEDQKSKGKN